MAYLCYYGASCFFWIQRYDKSERSTGLLLQQRFLPDLGEEVYGFFTDFFTGLRRTGLRIAYGFLPDLGEEAYGFFTGWKRAGLRIAYGFLPDLEKKVYGFFTEAYGFFTEREQAWTMKEEESLRIAYPVFLPDFLRNFLREWRKQAYGLKNYGLPLPDLVRIRLRIFYGFFKNRGSLPRSKQAVRLLAFTDSYRIWKNLRKQSVSLILFTGWKRAG